MIDANGEPKAFSKAEQKVVINTVVERMANEGLRTICIASKNFVKSNPNINECQYNEEPDWETEDAIVNNLTCLAIVGIEDPVRDEVVILYLYSLLLIFLIVFLLKYH